MPDPHHRIIILHSRQPKSDEVASSWIISTSGEADLNKRNLTLLIHNIPNPRSSLISLPPQLRRLPTQLCNLLVQLRLLCELRRGITFGFLDTANFLLKEVELALDTFLFVIDYALDQSHEHCLQCMVITRPACARQI